MVLTGGKPMSNNCDKENYIELYPSNWLYNAGVIGFVKVLEEGFFNQDMLKRIFNGNKIEINIEIIKEKVDLKIRGKENLCIPKILWEYFRLFGLKFLEEKTSWKNKREIEKEKVLNLIYSNSLSLDVIKISWGTLFNQYFRGLFNANTHKILEEKGIKRLIKFTKEAFHKEKDGSDNGLNCSICGKNFKTKKEYLDFYKFTSRHIRILGSSPTEKGMPNSFWNFKESAPICLLCSYFILHYPLSFLKMKEGEIFINTPFFYLTWDLNKFAEEILNRQKEYSIRKLLGSSFIEWAIKKRTLLGAWTMRNIEIVIKKGNTIDYFDLPYHITKILLDYEIASLIKQINEEKIFDLIVEGKFSELEKVNYLVLKTLLKLKNNDQISEKDPVRQYIKNIDKKNLSNISKFLPILYEKILKILKQTKGGI